MAAVPTALTPPPKEEKAGELRARRVKQKLWLAIRKYCKLDSNTTGVY